MRFGLGVLTAIWLAHAGTAAWADCAMDTVRLRGPWGQAEFKVELALTNEDRNLGLMNRPSLPKTAGMLFVFDPPREVAFWMRNTLIPLDMIFADRSGTVKRVHVNAIPHDETSIPGGPGIYAVLEINGGLSETYDIGPGTQLQSPLFGDQAAWPCSK